MSGETRILIVDDEEEILNALQSVLGEKTQYAVKTANNAFEAGVECERFRPHVMLLDIHLDDADGREICDFVQHSDDLQITRIIAMSGKLTDGQAAQLTHRGFDRALRKPFKVRDVIDAIEGASSIVH